MGVSILPVLPHFRISAVAFATICNRDRGLGGCQLIPSSAHSCDGMEEQVPSLLAISRTFQAIQEAPGQLRKDNQAPSWSRFSDGASPSSVSVETRHVISSACVRRRGQPGLSLGTSSCVLPILQGAQTFQKQEDALSPERACTSMCTRPWAHTLRQTWKHDEKMLLPST